MTLQPEGTPGHDVCGAPVSYSVCIHVHDVYRGGRGGGSERGARWQVAYEKEIKQKNGGGKKLKTSDEMPNTGCKDNKEMIEVRSIHAV